jgi:hypothetical protein
VVAGGRKLVGVSQRRTRGGARHPTSLCWWRRSARAPPTVSLRCSPNGSGWCR